MARLQGVLGWCIAIWLCAQAPSLAGDAVKMADDGSLQIGAIPFRLLMQRGNGVVTTADVKPAAGFPQRDGEREIFQGTAEWDGATVTIHETLTPAGDDATISLQLSADRPIQCDTVALVGTLPAATYAGQSLTYNGGPAKLPEQPDATVLLWKANIHSIGIPSPDADSKPLYLCGTIDSCVADQRKWNDSSFGLRLLMRRDASELKAVFSTAALDFTVTSDPAARPVQQTGLPTDLRQWTAPHWNTSARLVPGEHGQAIEVDTKKRDWNQYLVYRLRYPRDVARCVFSGRLKTTGVTGGTAPIEAARAQLAYRNDAGEQIGGWPASTVQGGTQDWTPFRQDHADMPSGVRYIDVCIGLYVSTGTAVYDALDLTAYDAAGKVIERIAVPADERTDTAGWRVFDAANEDASRPLAIDLSQYIPKPAGQSGRVTVKDGHFVFDGTGQRVRFWGTGWDHRGTPEQNAAVAKQLRRMGINLVRFHTLDGPFLDRALWKNPQTDTQSLDAARLDSFDNLVAALEAEGIYVDINLLAYRPFTAADGVKDAEGLTGGGGVAAMFDPTLIALQKQYARQLLDRVNPYTGRRYADDPGLALIELKNETSFHLLDFMGGIPQSYRDDLNQRFRTWLGDRRTLAASQRFEQLIRDRDVDAIAFSQSLLRDYIRQMRQYLRNDLGLKCPIAATQALGWDVDDLAAAAREADYIDTHGYWDHPAGGWDPTSLYRNVSIFQFPGKNFLADAAACRVAGKPMSMSEWNFCWPNEFIAEGPLTVAAVALRNDWDAAMVFGFDGTGYGERMESTFKADNKPQFAIPFQLASLAFHRGDLDAAAPTVAHLPDHTGGAASTFFDGRSFLNNPNLAWDAAGATPMKGATSASASPVNWDADHNRLTIDAPRLQAIIGVQQAGVAMADVRFDCAMPFAQIAVTSLDGKPISQSGDLLLCAMARAENTDERYRLFRKGLTQLGRGPVLLEPVKGRIALHARGPKAPTLFILDAYGRRTGQTIVLTRSGEDWAVPLDVITAGWAEIQF